MPRLYRSRRLRVVAILLVLVGLSLSCFAAARFDLGQVLSGRGDHWVAGGAPAISALSAARVTETADVLRLFGRQHQVLTTGTLVLWCAAMVWLPVLIVGEIVRPRPRVSLPRWATAFSMRRRSLVGKRCSKPRKPASADFSDAHAKACDDRTISR